LVGGGTMRIVNQRVPGALKRLGYAPNEISEIVDHISEHGSVREAPHLKDEHRSIFDCAMGDSPIHYSGHVRMMGAVQPFLCGSISKTVNMPQDVTVEDIEQIYIDGWKMGLKNMALYRDNCKVAQPLNVGKKEPAAVEDSEQPKPVRRRLPRKRTAKTMSFRIADCDGYVTAGEYPDTGELGEIFLKVAKQGSTLAGIMDAFAISVSLGLQYGVPLRAYVEKFIAMRFEPSGVTDDADFRFASSLVDYIFRRLAADYLSPQEREAINIKTTGERQAALEPSSEEPSPPSGGGGTIGGGGANGGSNGGSHGGAAMKGNGGSTRSAGAHPAFASGGSLKSKELSFRDPATIDAPFCYTCGISMRPSGSCFVCESCGTTSGCS
ncbi:MAG: vitamin B12-dependent ribonucleotide reductase, partial [Actinomycetota bacterium]